MTKEEILDNNGAGIYRWGDFDTHEDSYVFKEGSLTREAALKAMQEYAEIYATQQATKAKNEAVQECIDVINLDYSKDQLINAEQLCTMIVMKFLTLKNKQQ